MMATPFVLGGHSFIQQLGSDAPLPAEKRAELVAACLDAGIVRFDTTYLPERVALGKALATLGRRSEAKIIAWNFFHKFGPGEEVGGPAAYRPEHLRQMQDELQTEFIDSLVVHGVPDEREDRRQLDLALSWQAQGHVGELGVWHPGPEVAERFAAAPASGAAASANAAPPGVVQHGAADRGNGANREVNPYRFMVRPYNVTTADAPAAFAAAHAIGWRTLAASPFVRGWELNKLTKRVAEAEGMETGPARSGLADAMLRYSLFAPHVDEVIVAIRRLEWVQANVASWRRGPLSPEERQWLDGACGLGTGS